MDVSGIAESDDEWKLGGYMKKLFVLVLSCLLTVGGLSTFLTAHADMTISQPIEQNNQYKIDLCCDGKIIGSIDYQLTAPGCWKIKEVFVAKEFRNHGLGSLLIAHCMQHILINRFEKIEFDVMPIDPQGPTLEELVQIYVKLFKKLSPSSLYTLNTIADEECPWLATVKMVITKNPIML